MLTLIGSEIDISRLRDVIDFEVDYVKKSYEKDLAEKDSVIVEKDSVIAEKDDEIIFLKAKLKENGIK